MNSYMELKEKQTNEWNDFSENNIIWAFSNKQLSEGLAKWGMDADSEEDLSQITAIGCGGYIRKKDIEDYKHLYNSSDKEHLQAIADDQTGEGYILEMFNYELANHEYCITHDTYDTLVALGLNDEDIQKNPALKHGLKLATKQYEEA